MIRAIPLGLGSLEGGFRDEIQKNFLRQIFVDRGVISRRSTVIPAECDDVARRLQRALATCKKPAFHRGFLHWRKMSDEKFTAPEVFDVLDKKFAASRGALIAFDARVNGSLRRESVFFIVL